MDELYELFQETFGHPGDGLSDDEAFSLLQSKAYELGDGGLLKKLQDIKETKELGLTQRTEMDFEDSLKFVKSE